MAATSERVPADPGAAAHDLVAAAIGAAALALLLGAPWLVDRSGPDPFYKGPLIFPLVALAIAVLAAVPAAFRLLRRVAAGGEQGAAWRIDGRGFPLRGALLFGAMCLFPLGILAIGLQAASFLAVLLGLLAAGRTRPRAALAVAAAMTVLIHLAFRTFLDIWFPEPLFWPRLSQLLAQLLGG